MAKFSIAESQFRQIFISIHMIHGNTCLQHKTCVLTFYGSVDGVSRPRRVMHI